METAAPISEPEEEMSISDKMVNVISAPGDLFSYVAKEGKKSSNYSIPLLISIVVSAIFMFVVFSQPAIKDQMSQQQEKSLQQSVEKGKLTQEQADQARERMPAAGSPIFLVFGIVGVVVVTLILLYGSSLVYWLVGKYAFKSQVPYGKVLEVAGLSMYISIIGAILTLIIAVAMGSLYAGPHLGVLVGSSFDPVNKMHKLLSNINVMTIWYLVVVAIGLSKIFAVQLQKTLITVGILWVLYIVVTVGLSIGG